MGKIDISGLKWYIIENNLLERILIELGFTPKDKGKNFIFANLDGDNKTAICVYKNNLKVVNFTRGYSGDIITLVKESMDVSFLEALNTIVSLTGYSNFKTKNKDYLKILTKLEHTSEKVKEIYEFKILNEKILKKYQHSPNALWVNDGINVDTQCEFEICYDDLSSSIIIPIRDQFGHLIGIKNRKNTSDEVYMKYYYSYSFPKSKLLYNLNKAKEYIKKEGEVIVVESEKSVMKLWSSGIRNCIAISGSCLSPTQVLKLEKLNVNILLAYDKDKNIEYMDKEKNKFILNAGYIYDDTNLLNVKDSPIDKGIDVFLKINKNIY